MKTFLITQRTPKTLFFAMELRYFWFPCTPQHHQKSINAPQLLYRQLLLVKNLFPSRPIANTQQTTSAWFSQDLLERHVQNVNLIIFPPRTSFIVPLPASYPSQNSGSLSACPSPSCRVNKTCLHFSPAVSLPLHLLCWGPNSACVPSHQNHSTGSEVVPLTPG